MRSARKFVVLVALVVTSASACNQSPSAPTPVGAAVILAPVANLTVTPLSATAGSSVTVTWSTEAAVAEVQRCQPQGLDCFYSQLASGSRGQVLDGPLTQGIYRYRLVSRIGPSFSVQHGPTDVTITAGG